MKRVFVDSKEIVDGEEKPVHRGPEAPKETV